MPTIFAANESNVLLNGEPIDGVRSIEYRFQQVRENIYALGSVERIGMTSGPQTVEGQLAVASTSPQMDGLDKAVAFQISAQMRQGEVKMTVAFDDCYLLEKNYNMAVGGHGETVYRFTATRVREESS